MTSITPQLLKTSALAKVTQLETRVGLLVSSSTTELSPVVVYLDGAVSELAVDGSTSAAGTWTCPAGITQAQVECYGAGGGGGGGTTVYGGGGAGGGEYACEPAYAVIPGTAYTYAVGRPGQGGICGGQGGWAGGTTIFDTSGTGVTANGGGGGDVGSQSNGGTGSANTIHFDGGAGGVSSTGISSDNPIALGSISNLGLWWAFKGANTSNGALAAIFDDSLRGHNGAVVNKEITGLKSAVIATPGIAPPQVSPDPLWNVAHFKQDLTSSTPSYVSSPVFGLGTGGSNIGVAPWDGNHFTVSAWVQGDQSLGTWGYLPSGSRNFGTILSNCDYPAGFHTGGADTNAPGFALYMLNNAPGFYLCSSTHTASSAKSVTSSSTLPVDGTWHQVVGTWDGTTMKLYVDGVLSTSLGSIGFTKFGGSAFACTSGVNPHTKTDSGFTGSMSNVWIADVAASAGYVSTAFGATPETGGSGGGASGGSAGTGSAGTSANSSTGAAAGASAPGVGLQLGSGAGGAGGNVHTAGGSAPSTTPFGGGGGGAGASASSATVSTMIVQAIQSASYCGFDDPDGDPGALYDISSEPQTGIPTPYPSASLISPNVYVGGTPSTPFNGSMNGMVLFPSLKTQLLNQTVNSMTLTFTVQSTNASVLPVWALVAGPGVSEVPATFGSDADVTAFTGGVHAPFLTQSIPVPPGAAGRTVTYDITNASLVNLFTVGTPVALVLGGLQGSPTYDINDGSYLNPDAFAWNTVLTGSGTGDPATDMSISFELFPSSGSNQVGGDGAPGNLVISYIDPRYWPVTAIEAAANTDANGHSFAAGVTTDSIVGFDPTVLSPPRVPETWHSLGALGAGSGLTIDLARYRYSPEDGGTVVIQISFFIANGTVITGGSYNFATSLPAALRPSVSATASKDVIVEPILNLNAGGTLSSDLFGVAVRGKNAASAGTVILQVNFTGTASGNSQNSATLRIPLT